jgi:hypothetical protein
VLEKDEENHFDRLCEKLRCITKSQEGEKYPTNNKRKTAKWIGHILRRKCLLNTLFKKKQVKKRSDGKVRKKT